MEKFTWQVEHQKEHAPWGLIGGFSLVSALMAVYFIFSQNFFGAFLFTIIPIAIIISVIYGPKKFAGGIDEKAITVNNKKYSFNDLEYFSLVPGHLILKIKEKDAVYIPIHLEDEEEIRDILKEKIEEKEHAESFFDILNRILGIH